MKKENSPISPPKLTLTTSFIPVVRILKGLCDYKAIKAWSVTNKRLSYQFYFGSLHKIQLFLSRKILNEIESIKARFVTDCSANINTLVPQ